MDVHVYIYSFFTRFIAIHLGTWEPRKKIQEANSGETNGFSEARPSESSKNSKRVARSSDVEVPDAESSEDGER